MVFSERIDRQERLPDVLRSVLGDGRFERGHGVAAAADDVVAVPLDPALEVVRVVSLPGELAEQARRLLRADRAAVGASSL